MTKAFEQAYFSLEPLPVYIGPIIRADGTVVPLFCDTVPMMFWPEAFHAVTQEVIAAVHDIAFDVVAGGLTPGVPLAAGVAYAMNKRLCWVRKEPKGYSQNRVVDGNLRIGDRVLLLDDFFVHGDMKELFLKHLRNAGGETVGICSIGVINESVVRAWARGHDVQFRYLTAYKEIGRALEQRKLISPVLRKITDLFVDNMRGWNTDPDVWQEFLNEKERHPHLERKV